MKGHILLQDHWKIVKILWQLLKIFLSRTTEPFSIKLGTKYPWVKIIQGVFFLSNKCSRPSQSGDNCKKVIIHYWKLSKVFFSRTTGTFSTELGTKHRIIFFYTKVQPLVKGRDNYKVVQMHGQILKSSSPEFLDKAYQNLTQSLLGWRGFMFSFN